MFVIPGCKLESLHLRTAVYLSGPPKSLVYSALVGMCRSLGFDQRLWARCALVLLFDSATNTSISRVRLKVRELTCYSH